MIFISSPLYSHFHPENTFRFEMDLTNMEYQQSSSLLPSTSWDSHPIHYGGQAPGMLADLRVLEIQARIGQPDDAFNPGALEGNDDYAPTLPGFTKETSILPCNLEVQHFGAQFHFKNREISAHQVMSNCSEHPFCKQVYESSQVKEIYNSNITNELTVWDSPLRYSIGK